MKFWTPALAGCPSEAYKPLNRCCGKLYGWNDCIFFWLWSSILLLNLYSKNIFDKKILALKKKFLEGRFKKALFGLKWETTLEFRKLRKFVELFVKMILLTLFKKNLFPRSFKVTQGRKTNFELYTYLQFFLGKIIPRLWNFRLKSGIFHEWPSEGLPILIKKTQKIMNLQKFNALNLYVPEFQFSLTRKAKTETFQKIRFVSVNL